jgi:hypothetical protein
MFDGLYRIKFVNSVRDSGWGLVVVLGDKVLGGDAAYSYVGRHRFDGTYVYLRLHVERHDPRAFSVFGDVGEFVLALRGRPGWTGTLRGYIVGRRDLELVVDYRKLADGHVDSGANREPVSSR